MVKQRRLLAWLLTVVMVFSVFGTNGMTAFAASADETNVTSELEAWAAGITDEAQVAAQKQIWMDSSVSVNGRVEALLQTMTLEEKAAQMVQPDQNEDAGGCISGRSKRIGNWFHVQCRWFSATDR